MLYDVQWYYQGSKSMTNQSKKNKKKTKMEIKYLDWVVFTKCNLELGIMSHRYRFIFTATDNFSCGEKKESVDSISFCSID